jgi:hypothetical protein
MEQEQIEMLWCCKCDEEYPQHLVHLCDDPANWSSNCSGYFHCYSCGECVGECKYLYLHDLMDNHVCPELSDYEYDHW